MSEIADTTRPAFVSATLNFSTGTLVITMTETIDTTPISLITASRYSLKHSYGETITLSGSTPTAFDSTSVTLTMTEDVRARVLRISAMRGGLKGGPGVLLDVDAAALQDIGENPNDAESMFPSLKMKTFGAFDIVLRLHTALGNDDFHETMRAIYRCLKDIFVKFLRQNYSAAGAAIMALRFMGRHLQPL